MFRAYKYRIYPTPAQTEMIEKHFSACRLVYNLALEIKIDSYRKIGKSPTAIDLCYQLVELKEECPWLREVDSQALQASVKKVDAAYSKFFKGAGFPKFKKKKGKQSYQCPHEVKRIDWDKNMLTIPKIKDIPIVLSRKFDGKIKTVTISRTASGKYYASVLVDNGKELPAKYPVTEQTSIGIDLGIKALVTISDGSKIENPCWLREKQQRLIILQRRLSNKKKGSNSRKKAQYKIVLLHEKIANQRNDYLHKLSYRLIRDNHTIIMEDLNIKGMTKRCKPKQNEQGAFIPNNQSAKSGLNKSMLDAGLSTLTTMLEYKSSWYGNNLLKIGRFEPSSKLCSCCGAINHTLTLKDRGWACANCGAMHDRDENASINIKQIGLTQYCKNNTGKPFPEVPVELLTLVGAVKQEIPLETKG